MITLEHLRIYKKYHGDGDILIRCATLKEKELMDYESWSIIDDLVQDLIFVEKGSVSINFTYYEKVYNILPLVNN